MKNKKIFLLLIIVYSLFIGSKIFADEIFFETPEIETFENGNIIKANKGGKAVIDKSTEIIADSFEYDKNTKILTAHGNASGFDLLNNVIIKADKLLYDKFNFIFTAKGKSEAVNNQNKISIKADELEYNKKKNKVYCKK